MDGKLDCGALRFFASIMQFRLRIRNVCFPDRGGVGLNSFLLSLVVKCNGSLVWRVINLC